MVEPFFADMASSPCGACKFLRRKCTTGCVFAPHFGSEHGPARFAAIHKVFGASNASKMLLHLPLPNRFDAVLTIAYEAQARIRNPVHGCVAHIFALQQQVAHLQDELMQMRAQVAAHQWRSSAAAAAEIGVSQEFPTMQDYYSSSLVSIDGFSATQLDSIVQSCREDEVALLRLESKRRRHSHADDSSELQEMALMMMKNANC